MELIKVENAAFAYGGQNIFHNLNLTLNKGELCCLMGHNGCGKSTLLDCILGMHNLHNGRALIKQRPVATYKPLELAREIAYVPQLHERSFPYKVHQVVLMGRTPYMGAFGSPNAEDMLKVKQIMDEIGISHLEERPYTQISGGEMQMVLLARALVQETPVIIMDEPTVHLDFYNELLFLETVARLVKERELAVLIATHAPNQAFYFENCGLPIKVALMYHGKIAAQGAPSNVLTPVNIRKYYRVNAGLLTDAYNAGLKQLVPLNTAKTNKIDDDAA